MAEHGGSEKKIKPIETLTPRELMFADLLAEGWRNQDIASKFGVSVGYVKQCVTHILTKTGLDNRVQVAVWRVRETEIKRIETKA